MPSSARSCSRASTPRGVARKGRSAQPAVDNVLEGKPFDPHGGFGHDGARRGPPPGEGPAPGTYVQRRPRAGPWEGRFVGYDAGGTPPDLTCSLPLDRIVTVSAGGTSYRVLAHLDPQGDTNVVAVPLHSTNQTLNRLLL